MSDRENLRFLHEKDVKIHLVTKYLEALGYGGVEDAVEIVELIESVDHDD